jgi:SSS family transporter
MTFGAAWLPQAGSLQQQAGLPHLAPVDLALVAVYLVGITLFGLRFRQRATGPGKAAPTDKARSLSNYFLAGRTIPWWAIALSIVSAETSTLTIISIPGLAFGGDFGFLQVVLGYMLGRVVVALIFLPKYFQGELMTAYELIDRRFGPTLHKVTALLFLLTRAAAEGVRVFAVSIVVGIAIGTGDVLSIGIISALTLLYTIEGGMAAVIWTDVVQMALYVGGTVVAIATLGAHIPGGWAQIHRVGAAAGRFHLFNFAFNLTQSYTFWAGILGGTFLTMASHGTDQLMVQRMLAAKNLRESRLALLGSGVVIFVQFTLFLLIGAGLFVFYGLHPAHFTSPDRIFPTFIVREMPRGIAGLLVAAILAAAMSNLSAALNALSSTTVVDFYMRWRPAADARERIMISRSSTVLWALVLFAIAVYSVHMGGHGHVVEVGLSIASVAYGALLGVFLLGTLTRFANQWGASIGMIFGFALNLFLWLQPKAFMLGSVTIPKIAFTWYVLIGSAVTFAIGALASLLFRAKPRKLAATAAMLLCACLVTTAAAAQTPAPPPDFTPITTLLNNAIAAKQLPGAVVLIGHNGHIVFEQAYGLRKLAGEPRPIMGPDGKPDTAPEPMTEDTIFDMASLTKVLVTTTAIMQLYEQGKLDLDAPVARYLPSFAANGKENVTIRELLTHYSGLPPDIDLKDPWGLAAPDKAEGIRRAMRSSLDSVPGTKFEYSDVNFITLGLIVEILSDEPLDRYAQEHIFDPLHMNRTRYLPLGESCGNHDLKRMSTLPNTVRVPFPCGLYKWDYDDWVRNAAPTAHDNEGTPATNPDFDHLLRGTVHDPTTRRMGGVAGHAGVFSTAADMSKFCQALLDKLLRNTGPFPLKQSTLQLMTTPEQPATAQSGATIFTPDGQPSKGIATRGFGWDLNTAYSRPRGTIFPIAEPGKPGSFGHTGFTGTSLWLDPTSDTYVILLANAIHPRGNPPISTLRGQLATAAARALGICPPNTICDMDVTAGDASVPTVTPNLAALLPEDSHKTLTGIDVLEANHFAELHQLAATHSNHLRLGLLTNQTGLDASGHRTIDILRAADPGIELTTLFSPEHGIFGKQDSTSITAETDPATGLHVTLLYGPTDADKRPKLEDLRALDAVVIDLQDAGARFYTYETVLGYFLEAAAKTGTRILVLDRPNPIGGDQIQGPFSDPGAESHVDYMPLPLRHGLTLGELARYINGTKQLNAPLTVVPMQHWSRSEYFDATGLPWINPSPNLRSLTAATLYPGVALFDYANVSVGRGTPNPFEHLGASWIHGPQLAAYLTARNLPGVRFSATTFHVDEDANKYPFHGQQIEGVAFTLTDRAALDAPALGIELASALHTLYPADFKLDKTSKLLANQATLTALTAGQDPRAIVSTWQPALAAFAQRRAQYLLYR